jgi:hypothetical protein
MHAIVVEATRMRRRRRRIKKKRVTWVRECC